MNPMSQNMLQKKVDLPYFFRVINNTNVSKFLENKLKIPLVDEAYRCPIEGCGKSYRKENLAQMHVKHYHPEYTKFLDSTPNVADLAYARTVTESLDKSSTFGKTTPLKVTPKATPPRSTAKLPLIDTEDKSQASTSPSSKDSEIIKLLNTKRNDLVKETDPVRPLPSGLPLDRYPDFQLKDLLKKSEGIPNRDNLDLRSLSTTRPPVGIKTIFPVVRPENDTNSFEKEPVHYGISSSFKRKRGSVNFMSHTKVAGPNDVIIEGGQVIKIVRMKQEEIINCTCGFTEEDGLMIQCDLCLCWQHAFCNNIETENQVPEKYICYICQNPAKQRMSKKYFHDQDWLKHGVLPTTNFHTKDEDALNKRFDTLKLAHDMSGNLLELKEFVNVLKTKLKISE